MIFYILIYRKMKEQRGRKVKKFGLIWDIRWGLVYRWDLHRLLAEQHTEKMEYTLFEVEPQVEEKLTQMQDELDGF